MRRPLLALSFLAVAVLVAACSSSEAPGWTYAPPTPSPTPGPSVDASAAPSAVASEAPTGGESAAPSDGGGNGEAVEISAVNIAFEQTEVSAPADAPFTIRFDNKEAVPHNVEIKDAAGMSLFKGEIVTGPVVVDYAVPALAAGTYQFICTVHPNMIGTLVVGG